MALSVSRLADALGADVRAGDVRALSPEAFAELRQTWLDELVVVLRGQTLSDSELANFGREFGPLQSASIRTAHGDAQAAPDASGDARLEVHTVSNVERDGQPIGILGAATVLWHSDMAGFDQPPSASALYAIEVPSRGGETTFSNAYLAHDALPAKLRQRLYGYTIHHHVRTGSTGSGDGARHPAVWTHPETRCHALFLGARHNTRIEQLSQAESDRVLDFLWAHATLPDFCMRHSWQVGDLLLWDNRCTLHYREPFDGRERRVMRRVQVQGGVTPALAASPESRAPHPRGAPLLER